MARQFTDGSWGVRVRGVYKARKRNPTSVDRNVGDGRHGYRTRLRRDGVTETVAWDGQPLYRSERRSAAKHQKPGCRLASRSECAGQDQAVIRERAQAVALRQAEQRDMQPRFRARKGQRPAR